MEFMYSVACFDDDQAVYNKPPSYPPPNPNPVYVVPPPQYEIPVVAEIVAPYAQPVVVNEMPVYYNEKNYQYGNSQIVDQEIREVAPKHNRAVLTIKYVCKFKNIRQK